MVKMVRALLLLLRLDHADGLAIDKQYVIGRTGIGGVFANSLSLGGMKIDRPYPAPPNPTL